MTTAYNRIAAGSVERLAALSDGVFAVAMTLLALDLRAPVAATIHSEHDLWTGLVSIGPRLLMYVVSFMTLGIFWVGQQTQLNQMAHSDRGFAWIHIAFLSAVTMTPFATILLAEFSDYRVAVLLYWANIFLLGMALYFSWICATVTGLLKPEVTKAISTAIKRRIVIAQLLYAAAAALCFFNTHWTIRCVLALQLHYAFAPRLPWQKRAP
jgi:uncharacterized membrane protein